MQGKGKAKAKAEPSKKQKTSGAEWSEDSTAMVPAFDMGLQFHRGVTKMKNLLQYRASEKCVKACLNIYFFFFQTCSLLEKHTDEEYINI